MIKFNTKKPNPILSTFLVLLLVAIAIGFSLQKNLNMRALAAGDGNMTGYAWSENIGWINTNNTLTKNYKVGISNTDGVFSGYAWGENIGWINFTPTPDYNASTGYPVCGFPFAPCNPAKIDLTTGVVTGWARIESLKNEYGADPAWHGTGWISLGGTSNSYGLVFDLSTGKIKGDLTNINNPNRWAWAGNSLSGVNDGIGWIDFARVTLQNVVKKITPSVAGLNFVPIVARPNNANFIAAVISDPNNANIYNICTDKTKCPATPIRAGDQITVNFFLVDQELNYFPGGSYTQSCNIVNPTTFVKIKACDPNNFPPSTGSGTSQKAVLNIAESGVMELSITGSIAGAGLTFNKKVRIRVPAIGLLQ